MRVTVSKIPDDKRIEFVRWLREATCACYGSGLSLKEAKEIMDRVYFDGEVVFFDLPDSQNAIDFCDKLIDMGVFAMFTHIPELQKGFIDLPLMLSGSGLAFYKKEYKRLKKFEEGVFKLNTLLREIMEG